MLLNIEPPVYLNWGSTDGWTAVEQFIDLMEKESRLIYYHILVCYVVISNVNYM